MERLSFDQSVRYDGLEAAIHMARYSFAQPYCAGRRVLDVACGEGYGSRLLADWGADEVVGVDVSNEALTAARKNFGRESVSFVQSEGETLLDKFQPASFDLIVSFETIEHVDDPIKFLSNLKALLRPNGIIAISCPNDWWYFPTEAERNPYHLRKYHFEDFKKESEGVLGAARAWFLGGPITGFLNVQHEHYPTDDGHSGQLQMLKMEPLTAAQLVPAEYGAGPQLSNASYFVGLWGNPAAIDSSCSGGAAILPLSMDSFRTGIFRGHLPAVKEALDAQQAQHESARADWDHERHAQKLRIEALSLELQLTREQVGKLAHRVGELEWPAARYERISAMIPASMRKILMFIYRRLWKPGRGN